MGKNDASKMNVKLCKLSLLGLLLAVTSYNLENEVRADFDLLGVSKRIAGHLPQNHLINQDC